MRNRVKDAFFAPSKETLEAMDEVAKGEAKSFVSLDALMKDLQASNDGA